MGNVIFGAGATGRKALLKYGKENVDMFVDNNERKKGTKIDGIRVSLFSDSLNEIANSHVIIASKAYKTIEQQLIQNGLLDYEIYSADGYIDIPELVYNPYLNIIEEDYEWVREEINRRVLEHDESQLFDHVEIETVNRCNGICEFCPVNRNLDPREYRLMDEHVFRKIIDELADMSYSGRLALFSNNEPFLDDRILDFHAYARSKLPEARMHLCTNGTLLSLDRFVTLMEYLDELIIDNYNYQLELIPNAKRIAEYCESHQELKRKVTIILRKPNEVLTNRGGDSPNAEISFKEGDTSCLMPYKQLIIRPDGKVSLCCNDALGKCTMGDASRESLTDIWFGDKFKNLRRMIAGGRKSFERCSKCDTIFLC